MGQKSSWWVINLLKVSVNNPICSWPKWERELPCGKTFTLEKYPNKHQESKDNNLCPCIKGLHSDFFACRISMLCKKIGEMRMLVLQICPRAWENCDGWVDRQSLWDFGDIHVFIIVTHFLAFWVAIKVAFSSFFFPGVSLGLEV